MKQVKTLCYDMLLDIIEVAEKKNVGAPNRKVQRAADEDGGSGGPDHLMTKMDDENSEEGFQESGRFNQEDFL